MTIATTSPAADPSVTAAIGPDCLTAAQVDLIVARVCAAKRQFDDPADAHDLARFLRRHTGKPQRVYRCPFSGGTRALAHWHVGRVPSLQSLRLIAAAIRYRAQRTTR